jgi:hypothetical protein
MKPHNLTEWYLDKIKYPLDDNLVGDGGHVYLFYNQNTGLYKIGISHNYISRLKQLIAQSGCDIKTVIVLELEANYDEKRDIVEKNLHEYFADKRKNGEWFNFNIKDLVAIQQLFYRIEGQDIYGGLKEHFAH